MFSVGGRLLPGTATTSSDPKAIAAPATAPRKRLSRRQQLPLAISLTCGLFSVPGPLSDPLTGSSAGFLFVPLQEPG
jgi:hypothetical protein